jgi:glycosyltransferase involved in cell wall biosynthesis
MPIKAAEKTAARHRARMKILHFVIGRSSLESSNGADKTIFYLSRAQAALGAEVAAFCISLKPVIPIPGVNVRNFPGRPSPLRLPPALRLALLEWQPDFIHLHAPWVPPNLAMARLARRHRIPYTITAHGNLAPRLLKRNPWLKIPYKHLFEKPLFNHAAFIHAIADETDIRAFGITRPIVTAPNGFDPADITPGATLADVHQAFPNLVGKTTLLYLGRLDIAQKGLDVLLDAFALAARENPHLHLALAGPSWRNSRPILEAQATRLGITDRLTFCGPVQGAPKFALIRAAHAFLHPSRWEAGVPFAVLEALACGIPCITSQHADPQNLILNAGAALQSHPEPTRLAQAILHLSSKSPAEISQMSTAATTLIATHFVWQRTAATLLAAFAAFAARASTPPRQ